MIKNKHDIIIQARMGSTRLPGKILYEICNKPILKHVIDRLKKCNNINNIIIATTTNKKDDSIEKICINNKILYFRGSEDDVLDRYYKTAKYFKSKYIIRITSDCPLIDSNIVDRMVEYFLDNNANFLDIEYSNKESGAKGGFPDGTNPCIFSISDLEDAWKNSYSKNDREHVSPYMQRKYKSNNKFKIKLTQNYENLNLKSLHLSVDTLFDYNLVNEIYENLYHKNQNFTIYDVLNFLNNNPELLEYQK
jgi:spore coat polysaccharide biosynthesis protein SpsF